MSVNLGTAYAEIKVKTKGFSQGLKQAQADLDAFKAKTKLVADGFSAVGAGATKMGKSLTAAVTAPIAGLATAAVKTTATFDQSMSKVQALSGATGKDFDALRAKAIEMGAKTAFSASEAADAMGYMGLAGWKTQEMMDGLPGILDLAAASQMDLAQASDMVTDFLSAFGLEAKDATNMANEMAYAQANSNTSTQQLGDAFGNCAAQMHTAGQSMETTTALLEAMANQGTKGSEAGTALSATIRDLTQRMTNFSDQEELAKASADGLVSSTGNINDLLGRNAIQIGKVLIPVSDLNGNFRNLIDIMGDVEKATDGLGSAEKSSALMQTFTARSIKAVSQVLTEGTGNLKSYEEALYHVDGAAGDMSETMLQNLNGQLTILKSTIETLMIQIGDILMPTISKIVERIRQMVEYFTKLDDAQKKQIVKWAAIAAAVGPVLLIFGKLLKSVGSLIKTARAIGGWASGIAKAFGLIGTSSAGVGASLSAIATAAAPILAVVAAVAALGVAVKALYDQNGAFKQSIDNLVNSAKKRLSGLMQDAQKMVNFVKEKVFDKLKSSFDLSGLDKAMGGLVDAAGKLMEALEPIGKFIVEVLLVPLAVQLVPVLTSVIGIINGIVRALVPLIQAIKSVINIVTDVVNIITGLIKGLITGDFTKLKNAVASLAKDIISLVKNLVDIVFQFIIGFVQGVVTTIDTFTGGMITKIAGFFESLWKTISNFFTVTIPQAFDTFVNSTLPQFIDNAKNFFDKLPYNLGYALGTALVKLKEWGSNALSWVREAIPTIIESISKFFSELPGKVQKWLLEAINKIKTWGRSMKTSATEIGQSFVTSLVNLIATLPAKIWSWISKIPSKILEAKSSMNSAGTGLFNSLWDGMKSIWSKIENWFRGVLDAVRDFARRIMEGMSDAEEASEGSHADGLAYVPYNGYRATLHEGERVLTKNEAAAYNSGGNGGGNTFNFYSPKALNPYEANRLFEETVRKMDEGFD